MKVRVIFVDVGEFEADLSDEPGSMSESEQRFFARVGAVAAQALELSRQFRTPQSFTVAVDP